MALLGSVGSVAIRTLILNTVKCKRSGSEVGGGGTEEVCDAASTDSGAAGRDKVAEVYI